jgi:cysteine desulfurase/selenocysteine lyase
VERASGAGTPDASGPIGLAAAVNYMNATGRDAIERHEAELTAYSLPRLAAVPGLRILGPKTPERRIPVFAFTLGTLPARDIMRSLDAEGIAVTSSLGNRHTPCPPMVALIATLKS